MRQVLIDKRQLLVATDHWFLYSLRYHPPPRHPTMPSGHLPAHSSLTPPLYPSSSTLHTLTKKNRTQRYKYMGLQYSRECFCGNTYFTAEVDPIPTNTCTMPCSGDPAITCGGPWTNSVYIVGDPANKTPAEIDVSSNFCLVRFPPPVDVMWFSMDL